MSSNTNITTTTAIVTPIPIATECDDSVGMDVVTETDVVYGMSTIVVGACRAAHSSDVTELNMQYI